MDPKDSAEAMIGGLRAHFAATPESSLRRIHLVLFHDDAYQAFGAFLGLAKARGQLNHAKPALVRPLLLPASAMTKFGPFRLRGCQNSPTQG